MQQSIQKRSLKQNIYDSEMINCASKKSHKLAEN